MDANGVWIATGKEHHASLKKVLPSMKSVYILSNGKNETGWQMKTIGEGKAYVLYGGKKIESVWKKKDLKARTLFYDAGGREIEFLPGQFWYEIVPPEVFEKIKIEEQTSTQP